MNLLRNSLLAIFVGSLAACEIKTTSDSKLETSEPAASNTEVNGPMSRVRSRGRRRVGFLYVQRCLARRARCFTQA